MAAIAVLLLPVQAWAQEQDWAQLKQWANTAERAAWYSATQGSRLIPKAWLEALEQPGQAVPFLDPAYIESFGYLPRGPGELPVGFAVDEGPDGDFVRSKLRWKPGQKDQEPWVGMTCAACHTSQISYKGKALRIDGGQAMADFQSLINDLNFALTRTRTDADKWARFAHRVLPGGTAAHHEKLRVEFDKLLAWQAAEAEINKTDSEYGPGRVDAFGRIYNKVALLLGGPGAVGNPPDAPVSIPFIWHAPRRSTVQYNGVAAKRVFAGTDFGAVGRNTGEVIGVFGDVVPHADPSLFNGFKSSVKAGNLMRLEGTLSRLMPPVWPDAVLGMRENENGEQFKRGKKLYADNCEGCHEVVDRDPDPGKRIVVKMNALYPPATVPDGKVPFPKAPGTDPWMACNAFDYKASAGPLTGFKGTIISGGQEVPARAGLGLLLPTTVVATLLGKKGELLGNFALEWLGFEPPPIVEGLPPTVAMSTLSEKELRLERCMKVNPYTDEGKLMGYTSRPLNGIWATAPYLHNGSVPTLYDLLLPPARRPASFAMGGGEYDPKKMGLAKVPESQAIFTFKTIDAAGKPILGNSNAGHDYGNAKFNDADRYAIIEYLKSL